MAPWTDALQHPGPSCLPGVFSWGGVPPDLVVHRLIRPWIDGVRTAHHTRRLEQMRDKAWDLAFLR